MERNRELNNPTVLYIEAMKEGKNPIVNPGSGFFVEDDLIVTNIHVVAGATSVFAELIDSETNSVIKRFDIKGVKGFDSKNDLIILEAADAGIPFSIGDSDLVKNGYIVQVVGCPNRKYKTTEGIVHSIRNSDKRLRIKVETIKGNSGGPVLNYKNEVVGIHSSKNWFCGYAIPSNILSPLLVQSKSKEALAFKQWGDDKISKAYFYYIQAEKNSPPQEKITNLDKAIQLYPDYTQFYVNRGRAKLLLGQSKTGAEAQFYYEEAVDDYTKVLRICGESAEAYNEQGFARHLLGQSEAKQGNVAKAQQYYKEAIKDQTDAIGLCLNYTPAYDCRADVRYSLGKSEKNKAKSQNRHESALSDRNIVIEQSPCCAEFYYKRAEIKVTLCDLKGAIDDYCSTLKRNPNHVEARCNLELAKKRLSEKGV